MTDRTWTIEYLNALQRSDAWDSTAVVIVWDDFEQLLRSRRAPHSTSSGLGPRTPALIISPWTRQGDNPDGGAVDDAVAVVLVVLTLIEELHGLKPMTERDTRADPLSGAFDFTPGTTTEPLILDELDCG